MVDKLNNMQDWKDVLYDSMEDKTDNLLRTNKRGVKTPLK